MEYPERIVPDETELGIVALHLKRYEFALPWCVDRVVLDLACGTGYGSALLASVAKRVVGVDLSGDAIRYARERYARPNVEFLVRDAHRLELPRGSFDTVCSFETIEHLPDREAYLGEVAGVLRPGGTFLVSTPRVDRTTLTPANPFHCAELSRADFEALLGRYFDDVEVFGQRRAQTTRHRLAQRLDVLGLRKRFRLLRHASRLLGTPSMAELTTDDVVISRDGLDRASELLAVCRNPGGG